MDTDFSQLCDIARIAQAHAQRPDEQPFDAKLRSDTTSGCFFIPAHHLPDFFDSMANSPLRMAAIAANQANTDMPGAKCGMVALAWLDASTGKTLGTTFLPEEFNNELTGKIRNHFFTGKVLVWRAAEFMRWSTKLFGPLPDFHLIDVFSFVRMAHPEFRLMARRAIMKGKIKASRAKFNARALRRLGQSVNDMCALSGISMSGLESDWYAVKDKDISQAMRNPLLRSAWVLPALALLDGTPPAEASRKMAEQPELIENSLYNTLVSRLFPVLNDMSERGIPFNQSAARLTEIEKAGNLSSIVDEIMRAVNGRALRDFETDMRHPGKGLSDGMVSAWEREFQVGDKKFHFPLSDAGKKITSEPKLRMSGVIGEANENLFDLFFGMSKIKQDLATLRRLRRHCKNGRIHPLFAFIPETDRLSTVDPTIQNIPVEEWARSLISAAEGKVLVGADYGQIDLRVAAALSLRVQQDIDADMGKSGVTDFETIWKMNNASDLERMIEPLRSDALTKMATLAKLQHSFGNKAIHVDGDYQTVFDEMAAARLRLYAAMTRLNSVKHGVRHFGVLAEVFKRGLDPHLMTGIHMATRFGAGPGESPLTWLTKKQQSGELEAVSEQYAPYRKRAKPVNFGILYGIGADGLHAQGVLEYDLTWSVNDAAEDILAWFELYPEVALYMYWTICTPEMTEEGPAERRNGQYNGEAGIGLKKIRYWRTRTLGGRAYLCEKWKEAINYSDQGTSAQIILMAMADLDREVPDAMVNQVHDELLLEVDEAMAEQASVLLKTIMEAAANYLLAPYGIPSLVEVSCGKTWKDLKG